MGLKDRLNVSEQPQHTSFDRIEQAFLGQITDDMYLELTKEDTEAILDEILIQAIPWILHPKGKDLMDYDEEKREFNCSLDRDEINILTKYMEMVWLQQQIHTVDLVRQKYSGSDFKFTSQASHIKQLESAKQEVEREAYHLQSNYYRREKSADGIYHSTMKRIMEAL